MRRSGIAFSRGPRWTALGPGLLTIALGLAVTLYGFGPSGATPTASAQSPAGQTVNEPTIKVGGEHPAAAEGQTIPTKSLLGIIREGGLVILPLLICSFILLVFVFERTISLRRGRIIPGPFVKRFLHQLEDRQLDREQALLVCEENGSPVARVFAAAVKKWGRPAVEIEQALIDTGDRVVHELRHYLRVFNGIATLGPMLGLLGTVCGMIRAFNDIASSDAMGRPELLARGISEALLSTAFGLAVAVPAMILYWWFVSMIDRLTVRIDVLGPRMSLAPCLPPPPTFRLFEGESDKEVGSNAPTTTASQKTGCRA